MLTERHLTGRGCWFKSCCQARPPAESRVVIIAGVGWFEAPADVQSVLLLGVNSQFEVVSATRPSSRLHVLGPGSRTSRTCPAERLTELSLRTPGVSEAAPGSFGASWGPPCVCACAVRRALCTPASVRVCASASHCRGPDPP